MIVCVITNSVTLVHNPRHEILMRPGVDPHEEKRGASTGRLQHVEHFRRIKGVGTVVEGEGHDGFAGIGPKQRIGLERFPGGPGPSGVAAGVGDPGGTAAHSSWPLGGQRAQPVTTQGA